MRDSRSAAPDLDDEQRGEAGYEIEAADDQGSIDIAQRLRQRAISSQRQEAQARGQQAAGDQVAGKRRGEAASGICRGGGGEESGRLHNSKKHRTVLRPAHSQRRTSAASTKPAKAAIATEACSLSRIDHPRCARHATHATTPSSMT